MQDNTINRKTIQLKCGGGNGENREQAIVVKFADSVMGMMSMLGYIREKHGRQGIDWTLESSILCGSNKRTYSLRTIKLKKGTEKKYWFDITAYYPHPSGAMPKRTAQEFEDFKLKIENHFKEGRE